MYKLLISCLWFIAVFSFIYLYHYFFVISKSNKYKTEKVPVEVYYMKVRFNLNMDKINYKRLVKITSLIASFDIALVYTLVISFIDNIYLSLIFIMLLLIPVIIISFNLVGSWCIKHKIFDK